MSAFVSARDGIAIDLAAATAARWSGGMEIHAFACLCPGCWARWTAEFLGTPDQYQAKPDPVRLGLSLLCGTCEAKRRLLCGQGRDAARFFGPAEESAAWGRLRNQARNWCEVANLGRWDGRRLRDDKQDLLDSFLRGARCGGGFAVSEELRERWGWSLPRIERTQPVASSMGWG
jgi:hypothetical protein